ncbi:MAG TPA: hypothetical protein VMY35_00300 [Phycisphaerae bacterium]|nr:hypothetical protein [Phycisphaerae bacterium]
MSELIECKHLRTLELEGKGRWRGIRSLITSTGAAPGYMLAFQKTPFPGFAGPQTPLVTRQRCIFEPQGVKDIALLVLYYKTRREPGKARLTTMGKSFTVNPTVDADGKTIEGPDQHSAGGKGDGIHYWSPVGHSVGQAVRPYSVVTLETAFWANQFRLSDVYGLIGSVNDSDLPNFGDASAGTMLCLPATTHWTWDEDLIYVDYYFMWSGPRYSWNELAGAQQGFWGAVQKPVFEQDAAGNWSQITGKSVETVEFLPGKKLALVNGVWTVTDAAAEPRRLCDEGDFSVLDAMVEIPAP